MKRYSYTMARKKAMEKFVCKHQDMIKNIMESTTDHRELLAEPFVRLTVRRELDYSKHTYWRDILFTITKTYKRLQL